MPLSLREDTMAPIAILVCLSLLFMVLQQASPALASRQGVFLSFNLAFLFFLLGFSAIAWLGLFLALSYLLAAAARARRGINVIYFILPEILLFAVLKKYEFLPLPQLYGQIPEILGIGYIIFRTINVIIDVSDTGRLPAIVPYLNYCVSMFTFISGPIQRFNSFQDDMQRRQNFRLCDEAALTALTRLLNGALKVVYISPWIQDLQNYFLDARDRSAVVVVRNLLSAVYYSPLEFSGNLAPSLGFMLAALCYLFFLYFNFSGYTDIVVGLARLAGFRLPENFDRPFSATSFIEFWRRWHISLSLWFRDYCFMPVWSVCRIPVMKFMALMGIRDPTAATIPAYFISFGLLGLWHGRTLPFIICGLMFAVGSSVNQLWRSVVGKVLGKEGMERMNADLFYRSFSAALTFLYISLSITGLWLPGKEFGIAWHGFTCKQGIISFVLTTLVLTLLVYVVRRWGRISNPQKLIGAPMMSLLTSQTPCAVGFKMFLIILWFFSFSTSLPDFVYKGF